MFRGTMNLKSRLLRKGFITHFTFVRKVPFVGHHMVKHGALAVFDLATFGTLKTAIGKLFVGIRHLLDDRQRAGFNFTSYHPRRAS